MFYVSPPLRSPQGERDSNQQSVSLVKSARISFSLTLMCALTGKLLRSDTPVFVCLAGWLIGWVFLCLCCLSSCLSVLFFLFVSCFVFFSFSICFFVYFVFVIVLFCFVFVFCLLVRVVLSPDRVQRLQQTIFRRNLFRTDLNVNVSKQHVHY